MSELGDVDKGEKGAEVLRVEAALLLYDSAIRPEDAIYDMQLDDDGLEDYIEVLNKRLRAQHGPGVVAEMLRSAFRGVVDYSCKHCGSPVLGAYGKLVGFENPADVEFVSDRVKGIADEPFIKIAENPKGSVADINVSDYSLHLLRSHPTIEDTSEVAERFLALSPYQNPDFSLDLSVPR